MHLAKLILDPRHPQARRDMADAYEMHRTLCRAFATAKSEAPPRFLWRLEPGNPSAGCGAAAVLVQSATPGNWEPIGDSPGYRLGGSKEVDLDRLLQCGRRYHFRLAANVTVTRGGKRFGLIGEEAQQAWLARQGERKGFAVLESVIGGNVRLSVRQGKGGNRITVHAVRFDGVLEATDHEALRRVLTDGIGHAKALGLGLLSLAPARVEVNYAIV